jgi:hypothetical protein
MSLNGDDTSDVLKDELTDRGTFGHLVLGGRVLI